MLFYSNKFMAFFNKHGIRAIFNAKLAKLFLKTFYNFIFICHILRLHIFHYMMQFFEIIY